MAKVEEIIAKLKLPAEKRWALWIDGGWYHIYRIVSLLGEAIGWDEANKKVAGYYKEFATVRAKMVLEALKIEERDATAFARTVTFAAINLTLLEAEWPEYTPKDLLVDSVGNVQYGRRLKK
jgi:hypothetical protein